MLAYFGERISPHMTDTPEGFLICHDVPIGRVGEMEYLARELQLDGDPEARVRVTRDETEVFSPAALASFEGKPVTDGHPPETVRPENAAAYNKGHVQNVRRSGEYIVADLHITDPGLISEVRNGVKREVSCGYSCLYEPAGDGYRQKQIRGNHVAVVPKGRAGHEVAIKDEAPSRRAGEITTQRSEKQKGRLTQAPGAFCGDDGVIDPAARRVRRENAAPAAKKGLKYMKKETKLALLRAFGLAAQDAEPEELEQLTSDTAAVLDAEPIGPAGAPGETQRSSFGGERRSNGVSETSRSRGGERCGVCDDEVADAIPEQPGGGLEAKVDKLLELLTALAAGAQKGPEKDPYQDAAPEEKVDKAIAGLSGEKEPEGAAVISDEGPVDKVTSDAAVRILKNARPVIAAMKDPEEKAKVTDALLESIRTAVGDTGGALLEATASAARQSAQDSDPSGRIEAQQSAYDRRNPHKNNKEAM